MGALFNHMNLQLTLFRRKYIRSRKLKLVPLSSIEIISIRMVEVMAITALTVCVAFTSIFFSAVSSKYRISHKLLRTAFLLVNLQKAARPCSFFVWIINTVQWHRCFSTLQKTASKIYFTVSLLRYQLLISNSRSNVIQCSDVGSLRNCVLVFGMCDIWSCHPQWIVRTLHFNRWELIPSFEPIA